MLVQMNKQKGKASQKVKSGGGQRGENKTQEREKKRTKKAKRENR